MIVFVAARGALARRAVMYKSARLALEAHRALFRLPEAPVARNPIVRNGSCLSQDRCWCPDVAAGEEVSSCAGTLLIGRSSGRFEGGDHSEGSVFPIEASVFPM